MSMCGWLDGSFYVVVGPNGSGKSTLFDAIEFLFDLINGGLKAAVEARTKLPTHFQDLVWARPKENPGFEPRPRRGAVAAEFDGESPKARCGCWL